MSILVGKGSKTVSITMPPAFPEDLAHAFSSCYNVDRHFFAREGESVTVRYEI